MANVASSSGRRHRWVARPFATALAVLGVAATFGFAAAPARAASPCDGTNPIACENSKPGNPQNDWDIDGIGDPTIQGFATSMSVDKGQTISFKIKTTALSYQIDVFRLGYYGGNGARKVATIMPSDIRSQPACLTDSTGLVDCGNWSVSATWTVPTDAVSGIYIARPMRLDTGGASHIPFVVRDDSSHSDILFKTSDETWQAYNKYSGNSLYQGNNSAAQGLPTGRAYKVSYNRPFDTRPNEPMSWVLGAEFSMVKYLEANGYDVSYFTAIDTARRPSLILQHKIFMTVGHDEYWSGDERTSVEAARDAGVNLALITGNDIFWKTRWEPSIDGSATADRTLVCYKESAAGAKIDPSPTWTGQWRDARFSPPADGGRPENALSGQMFEVQFDSSPITIPAEEGKFRFWRNTSVANLGPGTQATLPTGVLGYEWDVTPENAVRPSGEFYLSDSTYTAQYYDTGQVQPVTHHLSLYRASSGALVFGAGTVQWALGLERDDYNDPPVPDVRMRQATANLLADMGAQGSTLQSDITPVTQSTDTSAPQTTIAAPGAGASFARGDPVTISGTSADVGGGKVTSVEVSTDGGKTWHLATGRQSWTYSWNASGFGNVTLQARAVDDSGNIEKPAGTPASVTVSVGACPCTLFPSSAVPGTLDSGDSNGYELGVKFQADTAGYISGVRFYKSQLNTGTHVAHLWTASGTLLASATFSNETATGWQQVSFNSPVAIAANTTYVASYSDPNGHFSVDRPYFAAGLDSPPLHALPDAASGGNGLYGAPATLPSNSFNATNYWVDPVYVQSDSTTPQVTTVSPSAGATKVARASSVSAGFSKPMDASTINGSSFQLRDGSGALVAAAVTFNAGTNTATLTPSADLAAGTVYTATVKGGAAGVKDTLGNALTADYSWSFTSFSAADCPCTLFPSSAVPGTLDSGDSNGYELGVKFQADTAGYISGVRFYKSQLNTGTHVAHLWTASGTLLASATFSNETATGWQQVSFNSPVAIAANTTYVASYSDPNGHFSVDRPYFAAGLDSPPLHALPDAASGGNGLYGAPATLPSNSFNATNYWVDPVYVQSDSTTPQVTTVSPSAGATKVARASSVSAGFSKPMDASTINGSSFQLRDGSGALVAAAVTFNAGTNTATLTPSADLAAGTVYTATVKGGAAGVKDTLGNALTADYSWSFTSFSAADCPCTLFPSSAVPGTLDSGDSNGYELGVKFQADTAGYISGVRFYKSQLNTGTHVAHLWTASGTLLASATFSNETATGWQQVSFNSPVAIAANTTYVASYSDPNGHFSVDRPYFAAGLDSPPLHALPDAASGGNGLYGAPATLPSNSFNATNYWVDPVYVQSDSTTPQVTTVSPSAGATKVARASSVSAGFSKPMDASTINGSSFQLRDGSGALVAAAVTFNAGTNTATLTPSADLAAGTVYTATVKGGAAGVKDTLGNALTADYSWSFTSFSAADCPCTLFPSSAVPGTLDSGDSNGYELGVKFQADTAGYISGVRFYKSQLNTGTHVAHLWTASGTLLASATFSNETATGWQQVSFNSPVAIAANTTYVASYSDPNGHFSVDRPYFAAGLDSPPLHALPDAASGGNGLYGAPATLPSNSFNATNYWVDPVYVLDPATAPDGTAPASSTAFPANGAIYGSATWSSGCAPAGFCGSASDIGTGVQRVELSIRNGSGSYWNGSSFSSGTEVFLTATGTTTWNYAFAAASFPAEGSYTIRVRATDFAGNVEPATSRTFSYDATPPISAVTFPAPGTTYTAAAWGSGCTTAGFCGTATDGGAAPQKVELSIRRGSGNYWNGTSFSSASEVFVTAAGSGSWTYGFGASNFPAEGAYTVRVRATDAAGNVEAPASRTFTYDGTAPASPVTFPAQGGSYRAANWNAGCPASGFCGTASDPGSGVQKVELSLRQGSGNYWDGTAFASPTEVFLTASGTTSWSYGFSAAAFPADGNYTLRVRATDAAGNLASPSTTTFTYDTTAPTSATAFPAAGAAYNASGWNAGCATPGFCGTAADTGSGVQKVEISIRRGTGNYWNGTSFGSATEVFRAVTNTSPWNYAFANTSFPAAGSYTIRVRATDAAGNVETPSSRTFTYDATNPTSTITFPVAGTKYTAAGWNAGCTPAGICGTASDAMSGVQKVEVSIRQGTANYWNGSAFASSTEVFLATTGTTSWSYALPASSLSADGSYTIRVRATDVAGNVQAPASRAFTYDSTPPTVSSVAPRDGATNASATRAITATFSEAPAAATVTTSTFFLLTPTGTVVPATVSLSNRTATLAPSAALAAKTTYRATVVGGVNGVTDAVGNPMASDFVWSFTTG